jgi:hypothetical protein
MTSRPTLLHAFLPAGHRMAAKEVTTGRWSAEWTRRNDMARRLADIMATEALRDPAMGAAMPAGECAVLIGGIVVVVPASATPEMEMAA